MPAILIGLLVLVALVLILQLIDYLMKKDKSKKKSPAAAQPAKPTATQQTPSTEQPSNQPSTPQRLTIYNSELADDLETMLNQKQTENQTRIEIGKHLNRENHVKEYLKSKNYHSFEFNDENNSDNANKDNEEAEGFTKEDYKRIMTLSNIVDKK